MVKNICVIHQHLRSLLPIHQADSLRLIAFNSPGFDTDGTFLDKTSINTLSQPAPSDSCGIAFSRGGKRYELSNHLGNVLAVVSDRKLQVLDGGMSLGHYFRADIWSARDYYPFGMGMGGRSWSQNSSYRFGFNGKETDEETGLQDYGFRIYHPAISKFLSVDPLAPDYPWYTPYQFAGNKPIAAVDLDGLEEHIVIYSQTAQKALLDYKENGLRSMAIQAAYVMTAQRYPSKEEGGNDWHLEKYPKVNWPEDRSAATYNNSAPIKGLLVQGVRENGETYTILSVSGVEAAQEKTSLLDKLLTDRVNGGIMLTASNGIAQNQEVRKSTRNGIGVVNIDGLFDWLSMPGAPGVVASQGLKSFVNGLKIGFYLGPKVMNELEGERTSPVSYKEKWKFGRVLIQETDSHTGGKTLFSLDTINFFESENGIIKFDTVPGKLTPRANVSTRHEWSKKSKDFTKTE